MFPNDDCARFFASEHSKNLRALAIETLAKLHVRRNGLLPPVVFDVAIFFNVAHGSRLTRLACAPQSTGAGLPSGRGARARRLHLSQAGRMRYWVGKFPDA